MRLQQANQKRWISALDMLGIEWCGEIRSDQSVPLLAVTQRLLGEAERGKLKIYSNHLEADPL